MYVCVFVCVQLGCAHLQAVVREAFTSAAAAAADVVAHLANQANK